jgi:hypothetical protein
LAKIATLSKAEIIDIAERHQDRSNPTELCQGG